MAGLGTVINVAAILAGTVLGVLLGHRLSERTRDVVTDGIGLVTLLVAALSAAAVTDPALGDAVGSGALLVVLGALLLGGIAGSLLRLEDRLEDLGHWLRARLSRSHGDDGDDGDDGGTASSGRFVDGFVTASLVFCIGPLGILGALSDGLGRGIDQLALKSVLDGVASVAFAATLGWGVAAAAVAVGLYQGFWTILGLTLGGVLSDAQIAALTATGGLLLGGLAIRLLRLRAVPVGDLLPALLVAPALVWIITLWR